MSHGLLIGTREHVAAMKPSLSPFVICCLRLGLSVVVLVLPFGVFGFPHRFLGVFPFFLQSLPPSFSAFAVAPPANNSWGFDAVGRGEVGVTARWHYDKHFTRRPTVLGSTFMGGKAKV